MKTTVILCLCLTLMACAENTTNNSQATTTSNTTTEKPNKFKVAAINKVKLANPGMADDKATCVVEQMTADGKIGLGEINQMQLDAANMADNASNLAAAYQSALNSCP